MRNIKIRNLLSKLSSCLSLSILRGRLMTHKKCVRGYGTKHLTIYIPIYPSPLIPGYLNG